jgi:CHAT domain-containing protein/Tfp pilus assembly protein PilF
MGQSLQLADSLLKKGKKFDNRGNMEESEFYYREAYDIYRDFQDTASWLEAGKEYASAMMWRSKSEQAETLYKKLLKVDHPANDVYNRGDLYNSLGLNAKNSGDIEQAVEYYQKSLPLAKQSGDKILLGVVYSNLGGVQKNRGNYAKATERYEQSLPYFREVDQPYRVAISLSNMADIFNQLSLHNKALDYYNQSLEIQSDIGNVHSLASIYTGLGKVHQELGNYDQSLISFQKGLNYSKKAGIPAKTATIYNNIGVLYKMLGEYEKAREYYEQSLAINEQTSGPTSIATTTRNLGKLLWQQNKYEQARPYYEKALELHRQIGNPYDIALSLNNMVQISIKEQDYSQAMQYAHQIKTIGDSTGSYEVQEDASRFLGKVEDARGNEQKALGHYKKAYAYSQYLPATAQLGPLRSLAEQYHELNSDSAVVYGQKAVDIIEKRRSKAGALGDLKSGYFSRFDGLYTQLASWVLKYESDISRAYKLVEQAKARSLSDELAKAKQNIDQALPQKVRITRSKKRSRIDQLYTDLESTVDNKQQAKLREKIRTAELDYAAYVNNLHSKYPEFKSIKSPEPIGLERAQELTDDQTAVLEYAITGNQLLMFLVSSNEVQVEQFSLTDNENLGNELTTWVTDFKDAILSTASQSELREKSSKLYNVLLKPFEEQLNNHSNLIVVPDGALAYLPFEALTQGSQYLIENFRIKYEPSLTSLTLLQESDPGNQKELLAVAGSQTSEGNSQFVRSAQLSALPSTLIEVDSIASHFQQVSMLKKEEVSEQAFKELLQENRYRYIHLATHGIIDEEQPSRSGLTLSAEGKITASSKEDGMLRSSEIFGLDINSDMVVLSACNTGLGKVVGGEGMLGMQRSFFYAGTSTVVVSLWNVYDRSTASFMNEFYKNLLRTESNEGWWESTLRWIGWDNSIPFGKKASAMRQAKLQMIKHPLFNHPVYWAPFIVVGR